MNSTKLIAKVHSSGTVINIEHYKCNFRNGVLK